MPMEPSAQISGHLSRRRFVQAVAGVGLSVAGLTALAGCSQMGQQAGPAIGAAGPEVTRIRIPHGVSLCQSPLLLARDALRSEGFTEIEYVNVGTASGSTTIAAGSVDIGLDFSGPGLLHVDAGAPVIFLGGAHVGCFELFGTSQVRAIRDLKGKTLSVQSLGSPQHVYLASLLAYVGLNPQTDITWVLEPSDVAIQSLAEEKVDALLTFAPFGQEVRARGIGHVVVNSAVDKPWSQYFCCMAVGHRDFVQKYPVATARALRAIMKTTDFCAAHPDQAAEQLVAQGFTPRLDYAAQTLKDLPYDRWREYDPEDTLRFYALKLHEIGMIKITPDKAIEQATDWRFFNDLKRELKA
jgi:NitT/TauT family transport system substrate-binding protein